MPGANERYFLRDQLFFVRIAVIVIQTGAYHGAAISDVFSVRPSVRPTAFSKHGLRFLKPKLRPSGEFFEDWVVLFSSVGHWVGDHEFHHQVRHLLQKSGFGSVLLP
jgi:hypothetical protein